MDKITKEQAVILTGFTGITMCAFSDFHKEVEVKLGRPVFTHEFAFKETAKEIKEAFRADFLEMLPEVTK